MALANDNFWGYTTDIIQRYRVRWIEAAIVSPCWTNLVVFYVEGDFGHLMSEQVGRQLFRTRVRGGCCVVLSLRRRQPRTCGCLDGSCPGLSCLTCQSVQAGRPCCWRRADAAAAPWYGTRE